MADRLTKEKRSELMSHIRSVNSKPEVTLRHALWRLGFRYRVNVKGLPGTPDIVFPKHRTVLFVHGCFWHGHKDCRLYKLPQTNTEFWLSKVARNQERDQEVWRQLEAKGWSVLIVWECELLKNRLNHTVDKVASDIIIAGDCYRQHCNARRAERAQRILENKEAKAKKERLLKEVQSILM